MADIGNTSEFANYDWNWQSEMRGIQITMTEDGVATDINAYIECNAGTFGYFLYDNSGNLLGYGTETVGGAGYEQELVTLALTEVSAGDLDLTNGSTYRLCIATSGVSLAVANDGVSNSARAGNSFTWPTYPDPLSSWAQNQPDYSIFLTYTPSGGGGLSIPIVRHNQDRRRR